MKTTTGGASSATQRESWESDAKLTRAAARGDLTAQRELLERALPVVRHTVRQLRGPAQDAEDAVQATLLAVLRSAPRFRGDCSLGTWTSRIAARVTLRMAKKSRSLVAVGSLEAMEALSASPPERRLDEVPRPVSEYLDRLPHPQRVAIVLRHGFDYTVDDIAEVTEASRNTVKYRLKEALATVRRLIRQDLAVRGRRHDQ